jgi:hypothetical protein
MEDGSAATPGRTRAFDSAADYTESPYSAWIEHPATIEVLGEVAGLRVLERPAPSLLVEQNVSACAQGFRMKTHRISFLSHSG